MCAPQSYFCLLSAMPFNRLKTISDLRRYAPSFPLVQPLSRLRNKSNRISTLTSVQASKERCVLLFFYRLDNTAKHTGISGLARIQF